MNEIEKGKTETGKRKRDMASKQYIVGVKIL